MAHPDLVRLRLAARGEPLPPLPPAPIPPPVPPAPPRRRRITPPLQAIGTYGPTAVAPLALLIGLYHPAVAALLAAGYLNLFLAVLLGHDSAPIHRTRAGRVAGAIQPVSVAVGATLTLFVTILLIYLYATVLLFPLAMWVLAGNGVRTCRRALQW